MQETLQTFSQFIRCGFPSEGIPLGALGRVGFHARETVAKLWGIHDGAFSPRGSRDPGRGGEGRIKPADAEHVSVSCPPRASFLDSARTGRRIIRATTKERVMRNRIPTKEREKFIRAILEEVTKARGFVDCIGVVDQTTLLARRILRWSRTHGRLAEDFCNRELTEREQTMDARSEVMISLACNELSKLASASFVPVFSNDPRGSCVKIRVPSGRTDDWGQTGLCVPTS